MHPKSAAQQPRQSCFSEGRSRRVGGLPENVGQADLRASPSGDEPICRTPSPSAASDERG